MDLSGAVAVPIVPVGPVDVFQKVYWGPRLWTLFHNLAEISNRRDMALLWNNLMRLTAAVMPCEQCRTHLGAYMAAHIFVRFSKMHLVTGEMVKARAVSELFVLHNDVNTRLGKSKFKSADMMIYRKTRAEILVMINKVYDEIKAAWMPLVHSRINASAFNDWKKHLNMMIALAAGGPN